MKQLIPILLFGILTSCTFATGNIQKGTFTIIVWHPASEALDLLAEVPGKVTIEMNRETEGVENVVDSIGDAIPGVL